MRHNKMKTWSLEIWKVDNQNHLVLPTSASPEHFYLCHSIHSISKTSHKSLLSVLEHFTYINGGILHYFAHIFAEESPVHILLPPSSQAFGFRRHSQASAAALCEMSAHLRASPWYNVAKPRTACAHWEQDPAPGCCRGYCWYLETGGEEPRRSSSGLVWDWLWRFDVTDHVWTRSLDPRPGGLAAWWQLGRGYRQPQISGGWLAVQNCKLQHVSKIKSVSFAQMAKYLHECR